MENQKFIYNNCCCGSYGLLEIRMPKLVDIPGYVLVDLNLRMCLGFSLASLTLIFA